VSVYTWDGLSTKFFDDKIIFETSQSKSNKKYTDLSEKMDLVSQVRERIEALRPGSRGQNEQGGATPLLPGGAGE